MGDVGSRERPQGETQMTSTTTQYDIFSRTTWKRTRIEWRNGQPVVWTSTAYTKATK